MIDWLWGLVGGLMIGSAAALYLLGNGRIMGASGILGGMIDGTGRTAERAAFLIGLVAVPALLTLAFGGRPTNLTGEWPVLVAAGLLVGLGTRLANGCTSGHGVCGISRLSRRGIAATAAYLGAGFAAMAVLRHGLGWV
ncbi:MAG: YeeE/YedE family protein [Hasllibacter sp.]